MLGEPIVIAGIIVLVILVVLWGVFSMWRKVPQDKALVVTGLRKRVISGAGGLVVPVLERADLISLENMQIVVDVTGLTSKGVEIKVGALSILKIKNEHEKILAAMEQFNTGRIEQTINNIKYTTREVLEGKLREIIACMTVEELFKDRESFANKVQETAARELEDMGLEIKAFTIKEISDENEYLKSLGKKQVAEVKKEAAIAESMARKEMEITIAQNDREKAIQVADLKKETSVRLAETQREEQEAAITAETMIQNSTKEKELKMLANTEEIKKKEAIADAAYEIEQNKIKQELIETSMQAQVLQEKKNIELTEAQMAVELTKKEQETVIAKQEAIRKEQILVSEMAKLAEAQANKSKIDADADLYKREKDAEAKKIERIKQAEAEAETMRATALAKAAAIEAEGLAKAKAVEAEGLASSKSIKAVGLSEAEVIREKAFAEAEAKEKMAEAYKKYGEAAMLEMVIKVLPDISRSISESLSAPISKIGNITVIDSGSSENGAANKAASIAENVLVKVPATIKATTGIDVIGLLSKFTENLSGESVPDEEADGDQKSKK